MIKNRFKTQQSSSRKMRTILKSLPILILAISQRANGELIGSDAESVSLSAEVSSNDDQLQRALQRPERITVVAPKYLRPQSDYHLLVNLANSQQPATVDLQIIGARDSDRESSDAKSILVSSGETQTVKFQIGAWSPAEYTLSVNAQAVDRSWNFSQETLLVYQAKSWSGFIQTDKAIYKPGQVVQFRAIFLTQTLAPLLMRNEINVSVSDPKRNLIKQWTELTNYRGLLSLELQLSEEPILGDWTIKVEARKQVVSKQFKVAEYILPTFDVKIQLPSYATYNESNILATVKAEYTYGKPVNGHVSLTVQPLVRFANLDTRPLHQAQYRARLVNGSADIGVDVVKDLRQTRQLFEREIEFFALVEEDLTGRKYNKSEVMKVHDKNIKIERLNPRQTFKSGLDLPIQLKVAYQDDTPVEDGGPELELRYSVYGEPIGSATLRPVAGLAEHVLRIPKKVPAPGAPNHLTDPREIELEVSYRNQSHYIGTVSAYFSASQQYMQLSLPQLLARNGNSQRRNNNRLQRASAGQAQVNVNDMLRVRVEATEGMQQITCQGLAGGDIIWALSPDAKNKTEFEFEVKVDQRMAPEANIFCFYIRPENKELIADSAQVGVSGLIRNIVKVSASRDEAKPGQEVEVGVFTKPNSLVGVLGIDQSVLLLKSGNDISQPDVEREIKSYGTSSSGEQRSSSTNAEGLFESLDVLVLTNNLIYDGFGTREGRPLNMLATGERVRALFTVKTHKKLALDSLVLDHELNPPEFHINKPKAEPLVIRSFFPETWLWENSTAGLDGTARFKAKMPDTITSWVLSAFSLNEAAGFGLSTSKSSVRVFRPFFIKLNLPYSIIRGETVNIQAVIFNYSKRPTSARVTLENRLGEFEFVEAANSIEEEKMSEQSSESRLVRVPAEDGVSVSFLIKPKKLGHIEIRMLARGELAGDGIVKKLLVKSEGQTQHLNKALLVNLAANGGQSAGGFTKNVSIEVPANAVADSQKVFVSAIGDLMGAGLSNVDDLLRLPYGCGEQNMINLVPNIVILNYLENTKRLRDGQRARAVRNIENGYQRQLNFKRSDGSFSAFGERDANGSVWLSAYVLKTLQQAKPVITVDDKVIRRAANFLARFSRSDGSIEEVGMLHNKELASLSGQSSTYLTAYCMIALLQRPIAPDGESPPLVPLDEVLSKGLDYLERQLEGQSASPYELAIIAYALQLSNNRRESADRAYSMLWARVHRDRELAWWTPEDRSGLEKSSANLRNSAEEALEREFESVFNKSSSGGSTQSPAPPLKPLPVSTKHSAHLFVPDSLAIEMSALALLTTTKRGELERALPIVKWLIEQQNSNGGFASTQDTVLAIEALATFAEANEGSKAPISMDVEIVYPRVGKQRSEIRKVSSDQLLVTNANSLVLQQIRLPDNITWVQLKATGSGAAILQVVWQYNLLVSAEQPAFYLSPNLDKTSNINYLQLSVCTYYKKAAANEWSNMAVMEIELPSGYVADVEALPSLRRAQDIKRIDTADGDTRIIIYLDRVGREEICLTVPAHRTSKVSNNKPVPVSIYDYYNRQQAARIFYEPPPASSCDICDPGSCSELCSTKPKRSDRLISLHEQRKLKAQTLAPNSRGANLTLDNSQVSNSSKSLIDGYQLLPLAPVLASIVSAVKNMF